MVENTKKNKFGISAIFSCYIAIIPVLEYYKSPLSGFNSATFLAMVFFVLFSALMLIENKDKKIEFDSRMLPVWGYILFLTFNVIVCFSLYDYSYEWNNLSSYVRFLVLFFSLLVLGHNYFNYSIAIRFLEKFLTICAILIFIQDFLYIFFDVGINISIPQLLMNLSDSVYAGRSGGLYMEPAHYAQSALLYVCAFLFNDDSKLILSRKSFFIVVFGIVASGSGIGYVLLVATYFLWLVYNMRLKNLSPKKFISIVLSIVVVILLCFLLLKIPFVQSAASRFIGADGSLGGKALQGRTYTNVLFKRLSSTQRLYGIGFGFLSSLTDGYVNSLFSHLIQCGYLSLIPLGFIVLYIFFKGRPFAKAFVVLYVVLICIAGVATPMGLSFFLSFLLFNESKSNKPIVKENL